MTDFDINSDPKTWTTRDGDKPKIYNLGHSDHNIHGTLSASDYAVTWNKFGRILAPAHLPSPQYDLISPRKTVKVDFWVNVFPDGAWSMWSSKGYADANIGMNRARIACKHIVMEVEEGEFDG